jgi:acyl-CoA hydrolase
LKHFVDTSAFFVQEGVVNVSMSAKRRSESALTMTQVVLPTHVNLTNTMYGGELMKLMDAAAGLVGMRHSLRNVVTAGTSQISFIKPILVGDLIFCRAELTYTGRTSMEVYVDVTAETVLKGVTKHVCNGYFFLVAVDENHQPTEIPPLAIENEEQQRLCEAAKARIAYSKDQGKTWLIRR